MIYYDDGAFDFAIGSHQRRRRRRPRQAVTVLPVNSVEQPQSRDGLRQLRIHIRRVHPEPETEIEAALQLLQVLVRQALVAADTVAAVLALASQPRLLAARVGRPRVLLVERPRRPLWLRHCLWNSERELFEGPLALNVRNVIYKINPGFGGGRDSLLKFELCLINSKRVLKNFLVCHL